MSRRAQVCRRLVVTALVALAVACSGDEPAPATQLRPTSVGAWLPANAREAELRHSRGLQNAPVVREVSAREFISRQIVVTLESAPVAHVAPELLDVGPQCLQGLGDCDGRVENGCETATDRSLANCGACGQVCAAAGRGWVPLCAGGSCTQVCPPGRYDRDGMPDNACEYLCRKRPGRDLPDVNGLDSDCDGYDGSADSVVFVAENASGTTGAVLDPVPSINEAIQIAVRTGRHHVLIGMGSYRESVVLANGVSLHGGYDPEHEWRRPRNGSATQLVGWRAEQHSIRTVRGELILMTTQVDRLDIVTVSTVAGVPGVNAYGMWCRNCPGLVLSSVSVTVGAGSGGRDGRPGRAGANGWAGRPGGPGEADGSGSLGGHGGRGAGANCAGDAAGAPGGAGGGSDGDGLTSFGVTGGSTTMAAGGAGGGGGDPGVAGRDGASSWAGMAGEAGAAGRMWMFEPDGTPVAEGGGPGGPGREGAGGGGGGGGGAQHCALFCSDGFGNGGGGGGSGGCSGFGGEGGAGGGGSFGVVLLGSSAGARIVGSVIRTATGGNGGNGGPGGPGGSPGTGGAGGLTDVDEVGAGGRGGDGGHGGIGGPGGSGAGGASIALYCSANRIVMQNSRLTADIPGASGTFPATAAVGMGNTALQCPGIVGHLVLRPGTRRPRMRRGGSQAGAAQPREGAEPILAEIVPDVARYGANSNPYPEQPLVLPEVLPEAEPTAPAGPSLTQGTDAERWVGAGNAALDRRDYDGAVTALLRAQSFVNPGLASISALKNRLAEVGPNAVGILLQRGDCAGGQRLFSRLRGIGLEGGSRGHFSPEWCPAP